MGVKPGAVHIAVIDTGFDVAENAANISTASLQHHKARDAADDPTTDLNGHGTIVAGLIVGKNQIGLAPAEHLATYKLTQGDDITVTEGVTHRPDGATIMDNNPKLVGKIFTEAALRACSAGHEIINLSWGTAADEDGSSPIEKIQSAAIKKLEQQGCLVIAAAGNSSYRMNKRAGMNPDDSWLRVSATRSLVDELTQFSSSGELAAPGEGVFSLGAGVIGKQASKCDDRPGKFVNGTSFSAPLVTGIAAQITAVLKHYGKYDRLSGQSRPQSCLEINECDRRKTCFDAARTHALLCVPRSADLVDDLINTALTSGYFEMAARWAQVGSGMAEQAGRRAELIWAAFKGKNGETQDLSRVISMHTLLAPSLDPEMRAELRKFAEKKVIEKARQEGLLSNDADAGRSDEAWRIAKAMAADSFPTAQFLLTLYEQDQSEKKSFLNIVLRELHGQNIEIPEIDSFIERILPKNPPEALLAALINLRHDKPNSSLPALAKARLPDDAVESMFAVLKDPHLDAETRDAVTDLILAQPTLAPHLRYNLFRQIAGGQLAVKDPENRVAIYIRAGLPKNFNSQDLAAFLDGFAAFPFRDLPRRPVEKVDAIVKAVIANPLFHQNTAYPIAVVVFDSRSPARDRLELAKAAVDRLAGLSPINVSPFLELADLYSKPEHRKNLAPKSTALEIVKYIETHPKFDEWIRKNAKEARIRLQGLK